MMSRFVWMLIRAGLLTAIGCERKPADRTPGKVTSEDVRRDGGQAVNTAAEVSQQTKEEFQKKLEARLKELDAEIAKLAEVGSSSAETWKDVRKGAQSAWDELDKTFRDASREF